jgi:hypothetical protein
MHIATRTLLFDTGLASFNFVPGELRLIPRLSYSYDCVDPLGPVERDVLAA